MGRRVAALGVGPDPIPQKKLTVERLANAIQSAVSDSQIQQRAAALGAKIRTEDGVANTIEFFEQSFHTSNEATVKNLTLP